MFVSDEIIRTKTAIQLNQLVVTMSGPGRHTNFCRVDNGCSLAAQEK